MMMILLKTQDIETINKYSQLTTTQLVRGIIDKIKSLNFLLLHLSVLMELHNIRLTAYYYLYHYGIETMYLTSMFNNYDT